MNTNLQYTNLQYTSGTTHETTVLATADELAVVLDMLATAGLAAEAVYDGHAEGCPHCMTQVLSEAA
jgi:hypothetical protein